MDETYNPCLKAPRWGTPRLPPRRFGKVLNRHEVYHRQKSSDLGEAWGDGNLEVVDHGPIFFQSFVREIYSGSLPKVRSDRDQRCRYLSKGGLDHNFDPQSRAPYNRQEHNDRRRSESHSPEHFDGGVVAHFCVKGISSGDVWCEIEGVERRGGVI